MALCSRNIFSSLRSCMACSSVRHSLASRRSSAFFSLIMSSTSSLSAAKRYASTDQTSPPPSSPLTLPSSPSVCPCCGHRPTPAMIDELLAGSAPLSPTAINRAPAPPVPPVGAQEEGWDMIRHFHQHQPPRGSGIQPLLDNNKVWAEKMRRINPYYFTTMATGQNPQYMWIGCSDSRVPANELVGLWPGDVFVHRNVGNVVCNSDLNVLAVLQYAVDCLKVEHVIVAGHYDCGGVKAALTETRVGLADHWILHILSVKKRYWKKIRDLIPASCHFEALCELNVLAQVEHIVETRLVQRIWEEQNAADRAARQSGKPSPILPQNEVHIHGWVYAIESGHVKPLLTLNRHSDVQLALKQARKALFFRFSQR